MFLFCVKKDRKYANSKPQLLLTAGLSRHKNSIMQQIGKKMDLTTLLNSLFSIVRMRFVVHWLFFSFFLFQIRIKMSYSGCSRLCEAVIMDWMQYFCPLLSVMTAVSELNIKLNSCQGDKCLEWFLFHWNKRLLLFLFFLERQMTNLSSFLLL